MEFSEYNTTLHSSTLGYISVDELTKNYIADKTFSRNFELSKKGRGIMARTIIILRGHCWGKRLKVSVQN